MCAFYQTVYLTDVSTAIFSVGNILVAILVRNELVLHLLYRLAVWTSVRVNYGKYYLNSAVRSLYWWRSCLLCYLEFVSQQDDMLNFVVLAR